ncbi:MAG: LytR C-terminal domain-containing protein [Bacteroidetes bacterium]|nr:LytR C-terminal domain-containing protein [Bacteroidota bacterium]
MKQEKPTQTAGQFDVADKQREGVNKSQARKARPHKFMKWIYSLFVLAFAITVYVLAHKNFSDIKTADDSPPPLVNEKLEVEVLDGAGSTKVAMHVTNILRSNGYDVVEMKRNNDGIVERSFVIDRSGNLETARQLAAVLGVAPDKVFQKIDRNLYLDITVVIGKDFSQLKVFQALNERSKR